MEFNALQIKGKCLCSHKVSLASEDLSYLFRLEETQKLLVITIQDKTNKVIVYELYDDYSFMRQCIAAPNGTAAILFDALGEKIRNTNLTGDSLYIAFK